MSMPMKSGFLKLSNSTQLVSGQRLGSDYRIQDIFHFFSEYNSTSPWVNPTVLLGSVVLIFLVFCAVLVLFSLSLSPKLPVY